MNMQTSIVSLSIVFLATPVLAQLEDQPDNQHSTITTSDGMSIKDSDFAMKMMDLLIEDGESRVADAKFFFNQCFGGGFLDDIQDAMGTAVKWVGGSASKHNRTAIGQVSEEENLAQGPGGGVKRYSEIWEGDPPFSFWGKELIDNIGDNDETIKKNLEDTRDDDPTGPNQGGARGMRRMPQVASGNGGENIKLDDPEVTSHHAILFAGDTDAERHFNTVNGVYDELVDAWGDPATNPNVTITVLFGDGMKNSKGEDLPDAWNAMEATEANLDAAIAAIRPLLNENEQFLFYGYDHGGHTTDVVGGESGVDEDSCQSGSECGTTFELDPGVMEGVLEDPNNIPLLRMNYQYEFVELSQPAELLLNGQPIALLDPFLNQLEIPLPEELLLPPLPDQPFLFDLTLANATESPIFWGFTEFDTGAINDTPLSFIFIKGDTNNDGVVNTLDIDPFVLAITDPAQYQAQFPGVDFLAVADINMDGAVNTLDIDPFVALITGVPAAAPEPAAALLLATMLAGYAGRGRLRGA